MEPGSYNSLNDTNSASEYSGIRLCSHHLDNDFWCGLQFSSINNPSGPIVDYSGTDAVIQYSDYNFDVEGYLDAFPLPTFLPICGPMYFSFLSGLTYLRYITVHTFY